MVMKIEDNSITSDEEEFCDARESLTSPANKTHRRENATEDEDEEEEEDGENSLSENQENDEVDQQQQLPPENSSEHNPVIPQHEKIEEEFRKGKFFMHDDRGMVSDENESSSSSVSNLTSQNTNNISEIELPESSKTSMISSSSNQNNNNNSNNPGSVPPSSSNDDFLAKILSGSRMDKVVKKKNVSVVTVTNTGKISRYGKNGFPPPNSSNYKKVVKPVEQVQPSRQDNDVIDSENRRNNNRKNNKWGHDKYNNDKQAPKQKQELIKEYGFDIRDKEDKIKSQENSKKSEDKQHKNSSRRNESKSRFVKN